MEADYAASQLPEADRKERPVIGITGNLDDTLCKLSRAYYESLLKQHCLPVILPPTADKGTIRAMAEMLDGLLLSGGGDINPLYIGEEPNPALGGINPARDDFELLLTRLCYDRQIPILGICRGMQVLTAALGGTIHQDLRASEAYNGLLKHSQDAPRNCETHRVEAEPGSFVAEACGTCFGVNSFHHQAVATAGERLQVTARAADGVIEAVEATDRRGTLGVQWHPEAFCRETSHHDRLFENWVGEAQLYRRTRQFHHAHISLDSHCDTPMLFDEEYDFGQRSAKALVDLPKMEDGRLDAAFLVAYLPQKERDEAGNARAIRFAEEKLASIVETIGRCDRSRITMAYSPADIRRNKAAGRKSVLLGIENGYAIGHDLSLIEKYRGMGVQYMTLCHNGDNDICDSASRSANEHGGLSAFGREVVREMNRTGMLIDLSHAGQRSFYDVLDVSQAPVVCTHSNCHSLCAHPRNLTDDQLLRIAEKGGVVQLTAYHGFLSDSTQPSVHDLTKHILHAIGIMGIEHVGVGSDFDGDGGVRGFSDASQICHLTRELLRCGLTSEDLEKLWGGNFLRVLEQVQSAR